MKKVKLKNCKNIQKIMLNDKVLTNRRKPIYFSKINFLTRYQLNNSMKETVRLKILLFRQKE